jgi:glucose/arabinose dehydrogenase
MMAVVLFLLRSGQHTTAAVAGLALQPIVTSGLNQPVYLTNAHDGSNRLFIVEQPGRIKVLRPGSPTPAVLLDITSKVLFGGERGLLGLAFHPQFPTNGRFFVDYTRQPDGATVIAEFRISAANPSAADPAETVLLTIAQPYENHNGGMVEFGPDGFLYIGMGDGGSANDPENRAQNPQELLGKILRIDVDQEGQGKPYASPPDNPYFGTVSGRDEVYALGLRNPWRFSFDPASGRLYVGDVGQNSIEEIDIVRLGGNYGWRIFEGTRCTSLGPASCGVAGLIPPIAEYGHDQGRCSVTGGYVYRGARATLPYGSYIYGDYCSGEIFLLSGGVQSLLFKSGVQISSFGRDEAGEIYVVGIGGTIHRIVNTGAPANPSFYFPRLTSTSSEYTGLGLTNFGSDTANLTFTAYDRNGMLISGTDILNPSPLALQAGGQIALIADEIFGGGLPSANPLGWVKLESTVDKIAAFFLTFNAGLTALDGADATSLTPSFVVFPEIEPQGSTLLQIANPYPTTASLTVRLVAADGTVRASATRSVIGNGVLAEQADKLFPGVVQSRSDYSQVVSDQGIASFEYLTKAETLARGLNGQDATAGATTLYAPQYAAGGPYLSTISVVNLDPDPASLVLRLLGDDGTQTGNTRQIAISGYGKAYIDDPLFFSDFGVEPVQGCLQVTSNGARLTGSISFSDPAQVTFSSALPLVSSFKRNIVFSQVASNSTYFTGIAIFNPGNTDAGARIEVFDKTGDLLASHETTIRARGRSSKLLTEYFPNLAGEDLHSGYIRISSDVGIAAYAVYGTTNLTALSAIPAQGN